MTLYINIKSHTTTFFIFMNTLFNLDVYPHYYSVTNISMTTLLTINRFAKTYDHYSFKRVGTKKVTLKRELTNSYVGKLKNGSFHFPISTLKAFLSFLENVRITKDLITFNNHLKETNYDELNISPREGWVPREKQLPIIDYVLDNKHTTKLVELQPGDGKGFISMWCMYKLNMKTAIVVLGRYVEKWEREIQQILDIKKEEIAIIRGYNSLVKLVNDKEKIKRTKFFIFSNRTLGRFIDAYEKTSGNNLFIDKYTITPEDLFPRLGVGTLCVDEVHQEFYSVYKLVVYSRVSFFIALSASLVADNKDIAKFYEILFPGYIRHVHVAVDKYTIVHPIEYEFKHPATIRTFYWGNPNYNHTIFEQSITKNKTVFLNYFRMIYTYVKKFYLDIKEENDKVALFFSTEEMCVYMVKALKTVIKDKDIRKYTGSDPLDNILEADIVCTTLGSGGTAIDIPNLICVINTVNVASIKANIQVMGRLRKLKDKKTYFLYTFATNINKHVDYHIKRVELFKNRAAAITTLKYYEKI